MLLCQDTDPAAPSLDGINGIVAMDDNLVWTASSRSSIKRWLGPQKRTSRTSAFLTDLDAGEHRRTESPVLFRLKDRVEVSSEPSTRPSSSHSPGASNSHDDEIEVTSNGIPLASLVRLVSPNEPFASYSSPRGRDPEVATLYSAASVKSVPRNSILRSPTQAALIESPLRSGRTEDSMLLLRTSRTMHEERELATNATPLRPNPDNVITGEHGLVRCTILNDRIHALVVDTSGEVAVWDIVRGVCLGRFLREDISSASISGSIAGGSSGERERSPREALETVRERIEGEAVISSWSTADTKAGVLMIHLNERCFEAEIYADEVGFAQDRRFHDESKSEPIVTLAKIFQHPNFLNSKRRQVGPPKPFPGLHTRGTTYSTCAG
jgi:WD repeat-containing protein 48